MIRCFQCDVLRLRVRSIPDSPGRWGKFLSCVIAAFWAATLWHNGPGIDQIIGMDAMLGLFGRQPSALWMTAVAVVPIVGMLTDIMLLRLFGATLGLVTWSSLLLEMIFQDGVLRPTMGGCLVGLLGCLNADIRLARLLAEGRE
jgi:hypothetical protein